MDMKETLRLGIILLLISAVAAGILAFSNEITGPIIAEREREEAFGAFLEIFPEADDFVEIDEDLLAEIQSTNGNINGVLEAKSGDQTIGYAFQVSAGGYGGAVNTIAGISTADNTVAGIRIGTHSETPNLGDAIEKPNFTDSYVGKTTTEKLVAVGSPSAENEVLSISGATISSFAVLSGVNDANDAYLRYFTDMEVEPIIEETEEEKQARFFNELFADADEFTPVEESVLDTIMADNRFVQEIFEANAGGEVIGYVFKTISGGYGGEIPVMTGINVDGTLTGIKVGANSETPGLGTKVEEADFTDSFVGKGTEEALVPVGTPSSDNEVQLISGATVSTDGVLYGVNGAREAFINLITQ
ncbi:MAG: RnfABCDGE type electron transport complex subunit G [Tissierella sp.]|nr:RnfABCDGE type electron transport complex subunit G [Tissierella sp.]